VRVATVGYAALVVVSVLQAATGVALFDVGLVAAVLYLLGVGLLGYEGPGWNVMVLPMDASFDEYNLERLRSADTLLLGRTSYELFRGFWPARADDADAPAVHRETGRIEKEIDKAVVSDTLTPGEIAPWQDTPPRCWGPARRSSALPWPGWHWRRRAASTARATWSFAHRRSRLTP
jgi:hypothetical protein